MASGFDMVRLELAFGRDKLDDWLVAELDSEQYAKVSIAPHKRGKPSTVDAVLSSVEAAAEKRGGDDDSDEEEDDGGPNAAPYEHFKMKIVRQAERQRKPVGGREVDRSVLARRDRC